MEKLGIATAIGLLTALALDADVYMNALIAHGLVVPEDVSINQLIAEGFLEKDAEGGFHLTDVGLWSAVGLLIEGNQEERPAARQAPVGLN